MSLEDAIGSGPDFTADSVLDRVSRSVLPDLPENVSADAVLNRLNRKLSLTKPAEEEKPEKPEKTDKPDLSSFGTPVGDLPDLSQYGTPADAVPLPMARPAEAPGPVPLSSPLHSIHEAINPLTGIKGAAAGVANTVGGRLQGAARLQNQAQPYLQSLQYDPEGNVIGQNPVQPPTPIEQNPVYRAGAVIKSVAPELTPEESNTVLGKVSQMGGAILPDVLLMAVNPLAGMGSAAVGMGVDTYGKVYEEAKKHGADDDTASSAASKSALAAGVLGSLPLGAGKYAQSLIAKMATSSAAFATAGEAQEAILQQIAKDYDPKAGYTLDQKRLIAELILGAGMGGLHHAAEGKPENVTTSPDDVTPPGPQARAPAEGLPPPPGEEQPASAHSTGTPPPGPDTGASGAGAQPGPRPGDDGGGTSGAESQQRQQQPRDDEQPEAEPARGAKGADYTMDPKTRSKMEDVLRRFDPKADWKGMSDADLFNAVQEHLRDTSSTGYTAKPETAEEKAAREETAKKRDEDDILRKAGWSEAHINAMTPEQRKKYSQPQTKAEEASPQPEATGRREAPIRPQTANDVVKAQPVEPKSQAQADAENYPHSHVELPQFGLVGRHSVSIETGVGQDRKGVGPDGKPWEITLQHSAYGRIKSTTGNDGQPLDIHVGPHPSSPHIFVIDQHDPSSGVWDEHKILAGYRTPLDAMHAYINSYSDLAKNRIGGMTAFTPDQFKDWLKNGDHTKPLMRKGPAETAVTAGPEAVASPAEKKAQESGGTAPEPESSTSKAAQGSVQNSTQSKINIEGSADALRSIRETGKPVAATAKEPEPGEGKETSTSGAQPADIGPKDQEDISVHRDAIEKALGPDADRVSQVDIASAAEMMADHPDMDVAAAFGRAVIQNAVRQKFLTALEAAKAYGQEVNEVLGTEREGASGGSAHAEPRRAEPRQERASGTGETRELPGRGEVGSHPASAEVQNEPADDTAGKDTNAERNASREAAPAEAEREAAEGTAAKPEEPKPTVEKGVEETELAKQGTEKLLPPAQRGPVEAAVRELMKRLLGEHVKVHFQNGLIGLGEHAKARWGELGESAKAKGMYYPYRHIIRLALTDGIDETAFHEAYHASEYQLQTPQERALMERETPAIRKWIAKKRGYSEAEVNGMAPEEVRAVGAEEYMKERVEGVENAGAGLHVGVRRWWQRLWDALRALANKLRGMGFKTYNDIYGDLYEGKHADRSGDTPRREADRRKEEVHEEDLARPDDAMASIFEKRTAANNRVSNKIANLFSDSKRADMHEVLADYSYREKLLQKELEARYLGLTPEEAAKIFPEASKLPDAMQFYIKKGLISGKIVDDSNKFKKQYLDPLVKAANEARISREDIGDYLLAKGALERNRNIAKLYKKGDPFFDAMTDHTIAGGSGFSNKEALDKIKEYETGPKADAFKDIWKRTRDIVNFNREMMVHFGLETRDTIEEWKRNGKDYIPYAGFEDTPEENPEEYFGNSKRSALGIQGPETKRAFGRKSKADNPLVHLIDQTYRTIERGERNMHYNSIWDAFGTLEKNGVNVKDIVSVNKGTPQKAIDNRTGLVKMTDGGRGAQEKGAVNFKRNGIPRTMVFKSEKLAKSILRNSPWTFWGLRHMLLGINKLKSLWTHYSPDFAARHFLGRYMIEGVLNAQQLKDTGKFSSAKWIADAIPQIGRASRAIAKRNKGDDAGQLGKYWDEMQAHGGHMAFRQMRDINNIKNELTRDLRDLTGKAHLNPLQILHRITSRIDEIFNTWDNATRLATYAQARDQGMTPQASAHRSLNATVNYQKAGLVANVAGVVFPFFKVSVNTGTRMFGAMQQSNRMRRVFAGVFFAGVGLALVNYLLGGNDEDGTPFFEKVPPWERALGAVFINPLDKDDKGRPQKYVDPMPYNYAMPMTWGYHLTGMLLSKLGYIKSSISTSEHIMDMIKSAAMAFTPFGETGNLTDMITPEVLKPLVHVANNKDWRGNPIHNDSKNQKGPSSENGRDSTGEGWKAAAKGLNSLTGGTPYSSGLLDAYPESIRELADQMFGSQKRFGMEVGASVKSIANGEAPKPTETPIARVFRGVDYDQADAVAFSKEWYAAKEEKGAFDKADADLEAGINEAQAQKFVDDHEDAPTRSEIFGSASKEMSRLRKEEAEATNETIPYDQKKAKLDAIRQEMRDVQNHARAESAKLKELVH